MLKSALICFVFLLAGCASVDSQEEESVTGAERSAGNSRTAAIAESRGIEPNVVAYEDYDDPLIGLNRRIFAFNDVVYRYALIPAARGYLQVVPGPVRESVGDFFYNIKSPIYLLNNLAQGRPNEAGSNLLRFTINSTLGIAGFFDPADAWFGLEKTETRTRDTMVHYELNYGAYLVLPFIGPSSLRDGSSFLVDALLNPLGYLLDNPESTIVRTSDNFQQYAPNADSYLSLREESDDFYIFLRNLYLQGLQRDEEFPRGEEPSD